MTRKIALTLLWWGWAMALFVLLIMLSANSALFGDDTKAVWEWFLPNIVPVITLVGAAAYAGATSSAVPPDAPTPLFIMTIVVSVFYLVLLTASIVSTLYSPAPLAALRQSGLWLGPVQGMATSALGLFFLKR